MDRERLAWLRMAAVATDGAVLGATWLGLVELREHLAVLPGLPPLPVGVSGPLGWLVVPLWLVALAGAGSYRGLRRGTAAEGWSRIGRGVLGAVLAAVLLLFLARIPVNRSLLVGFAALSGPAIGASRAVHRAALGALLRRRLDPHRVVLIGEPSAVDPVVAEIWARGQAVVDRITPGDLPQIGDRLGAADEVQWVGLPTPEQLLTVARLCDELGVPWALDGSFLGPRTAAAELEDRGGYAVLRFSTASDMAPDRLLKRVVDLVGAAVGLSIAALPVALLMLAIRAQDGGPAVFRQARVGRYGRPFQLYKLRTMVGDAEARRCALDAENTVDGPAFKHAADPRVTRFGAWLRRWSLDELPQLVNVLRGEMSLVGPRPPLPEEVERYARPQRRRLSVRPGLTGLWQVSGRADLPFERWIELDLQYVDRWSLWLDLLLLLRTVPAVLSGAGAR